MTSSFDRRRLISGIAAIPLLARTSSAGSTQSLVEDLVIDLPAAPESIDPALAYAPRDWSIVHAIYDALVQFDADGVLVPLAAETFETIDATTFTVTLRAGMSFHDGSPVTTEAIVRSVDYMRASSSQMVDTFSIIERVDIQDDLRATIVSSAPAPWLPAQLAAWIVLLPEGVTADSALTTPVGSGPYAVDSIDPGNTIVLTRNASYPPTSPKGIALAERVTYRFVPEASTRVADLSSGAASIVTEMPGDQRAEIEDGGATFRVDPVVGVAYIRLPNDVAPFDDVRVRQALNHAVDVESIATALINDASHRISSLYPDERAIGFDPSLEAYAYDPERARQLLADAGYPDGFTTQLEITNTARQDVAEAISAQLGEIGIEVEIVTSDYATFNEGWKDATRPPMRMVTWTPLYDPSTLIGLVFASSGYLSRYTNIDLDAAYDRSASTADAATRLEALQTVGKILHDDAAAVWLWNLTATYGVASEAAAWTSRGDEYVIPTRVAQ